MELERLSAWLKTWPGWQENTQLYVDYTDGIAGNCGLFSTGVEEIQRKKDVLGNVTVRYRHRFTLYRVVADATNGNAHALWVLELQKWIGQQSILGLAPVFGDVPTEEFIRAEKGRLHKTRQPNNKLYAVELTVEFIKFYEVNE